MTTDCALALSALADSFPTCDAMNLGYAVQVEGELPSADVERAIGDVLRSDPLLDGNWQWRTGRAEPECLATLAAEHLSMPISKGCPFRAALWSSSATNHLFLLAVHHAVADGVVLGRLAEDISRRLARHDLAPVTAAYPRALPPPERRDAPRLSRLPLRPAPPSVRASCRNVTLPADLAERFRQTMRKWHSTPFAGAVTSVAAALAAATEQNEIPIAIQVAGRNSSDALRAPGPWYDHATLHIGVEPGAPLRAILLQVNERLAKTLATAGNWASHIEDEALPEVLVVFDQHPLSALRIAGRRVTPLAVDRHPRRADGAREYLVATEADIVVFFREQAGTIGVSLFTKIARVADATVQSLLDAVIDVLRALCDEGESAIDPFDLAGGERNAEHVAWPRPALSREPLVDAVSPAFRLRRETLDAFARDARLTLADWGTPPWLGNA